jgi:hypothetical protein
MLVDMRCGSRQRCLSVRGSEVIARALRKLQEGVELESYRAVNTIPLGIEISVYLLLFLR